MVTKRAEWEAGWRNVAAAAVGLGFGIPSYGPVSSLFLRSLETEFGWSKAVAAGAIIALPATAVLLPWIGRLIDRFGLRRAVGFSIVCSVLSFAGLSRLEGSVEQYYALIFAIYVLGAATGPIAYTRLVAAQFRLARGAALAVAQVGIAFVGAIMPPFLGSIIDVAGWRKAYLVFAATSLIGGLAAWLLMRPVDDRASGDLRGQPRGGVFAVLGRGEFWLLGLPIMLISLASYGFVFQFQSMLIYLGNAPKTATLLLSVLSVATMISRLAVGYLLDSARPALWAAAMMGTAAVGPVLLLLPVSHLAVTIVAVSLVGISIGAELDLMSYFCVRIFGLDHYSQVYGMLSVFLFVGIAVGGVAFGAIYDLTTSYHAALVSMTVLLALSAAPFVAIDLGHLSRLGADGGHSA